MFRERDTVYLSVELVLEGHPKAGDVSSSPHLIYVRASQGLSPGFSNTGFKYGSAPDHQRVKGLECRAVDFGFGLEGNGEIQGLGRRMCIHLDSGKS